MGKSLDRWMIWLSCWISRRLLSFPMISSISLRLPLKTCGLFDTGFAGDAFDVASNFDLSIPADIDQSLFSFGDVSSSTRALAAGSSGLSTAIDHHVAMKYNVPSAPELMELDFDLMDPLSGLDDPLADDNLDAFVNLNSFFMEDSFFGNESLPAKEEPADMKDILDDLFANTAEVTPVIHIPVVGSNIFSDETTPVVPSKKSSFSKSSYKRKAQESVDLNPDEIIVFKSPKVSADPQVDHDYIAKSMVTNHKGKINTPKRVKITSIASESSTPKRVRITSTVSDGSEISTTSIADVTEVDVPIDKQAVRRMKNNVASKRSREQRKQKFSAMDEEADELIEANDRLRIKIVELEKQAKEMKALLVAKMSGNA